MKEHEFWRERATGSLYAVELADGLVTGSCGPLSVSETDERFLPALDYTSDRAAWIEEHREDFDFHRPVTLEGTESSQGFGGAGLGRLRVEQTMHRGVLACVPSTSLREVARMMASARIHAVVVWGDEEDDSEGIWGIVSDLDLAAAAARGEIYARQAAGISRTPVVTVRQSTDLRAAAELMAQHRVAHLVVVDDEHEGPVGILSTLDLARAIARAG